MGRFIQIKSDKFPILPGEEKEIINDGIYGKALAEYLQIKLAEKGYSIPFVCAEDWGWWVEINTAPIKFGVCVYAHSETNDPIEFVCADGFKDERKWSWSKFRFIDTNTFANKLHEDLLHIFHSDNAVEVVGLTNEFPW